MGTDADGEVPCLERLHREAFTCLETFPSKIIELNELIDEYMPESMKNNGSNVSSNHRASRCQSTLSTARNHNLPTVPEFDVTSYYSLSMYDRGRVHHGICKRRHYRMRGIGGSIVRRRPGPLGQLLAFIVSRLTVYTKKMVVAPSQYIVDSIISMFLQRRQMKSVQCGPSSNWNSSLSTYVTKFKEDNTTIGNLIDIIRPATVQLITHTTTLKRWLQALSLATTGSPPSELANATRSTETIDCWAYELFFHLKYLQAIEDETKSEDELTHNNLWHRLVQLRNNYIVLYEMLHHYQKLRDLDSTEGQE